MGIDGVGKPGGASGTVGVAAPLPVRSSSSDPFSVGSTAEASRVKGSDALVQLQRGDLSVEQYLEAQVIEATQHVAAQLSPEQLGFVKESLRQQLQSDPVLVELVRKTVGSQSEK